jgi:hypothetical protein
VPEENDEPLHLRDFDEHEAQADASEENGDRQCSPQGDL